MVLHSFLESFILPLAHELFLIPVALAHPKLSFVYALMSTTASVMGMSVGYYIGSTGGKSILTRFINPKIFELAKREIHRYDAWAVALACFTPVPVKVFALVAGAVHLNYKKMIVIAFFSRGARYFLVAVLLYFYGATIREWLLDYMNIMMLVLFVAGAIAYFAYKQFEHYLMRKEHVE